MEGLEEREEEEAKLLEYSTDCVTQLGLGARDLTGLGDVCLGAMEHTGLGEVGFGAMVLTGLGDDDLTLSRISSPL